MEALPIETFKPDKITAIIVDDKCSGEFNYKSVKFLYDGGKTPSIHIHGNFRLFRIRNKNGDIYSLSITCDATNEWFFKELRKVISRESCRMGRKHEGKIVKPEDFELVRDNRTGQSVYTKIYSKV